MTSRETFFFKLPRFLITSTLREKSHQRGSIRSQAKVVSYTKIARVLRI